MKLAIFHNYLDNIGGAEIVGLILARELGADIYTTNIDKEKIIKMGFEDVLPRIFSIGKVPINAPFKQQLALLRFRFLNLNKQLDKRDSKSEAYLAGNFARSREAGKLPRIEQARAGGRALAEDCCRAVDCCRAYDYYIIDGDWAMSGAVNNKPNLWYVHSSIREIWDLYKYTRQNIVPWSLKCFFDIWVVYNRYLNKKYVNCVDKLVCNSENTKARIKKYLNKDAVVINPPIETSKFYFGKIGNYWLSANRLLGTKRIDMQINAFKRMPEERLIIIGSYEKARHFKKYADYCNKIKPKNVGIKSWVSQQELIDLYANCKGFITTSQDEDFGMNAVEAMASGKPVIAPNEGGYKETVINAKTGILIDNINEDKLIEAIKIIGKNPESYKNACLEQAKNFDTKIFIEKIKQKIFEKKEETKFETILLIPNFNGMAHLRECLDSVACQTYKNFKTIVLDDKSIDNSIDFINKNFKNVEVLINPENFGFAKSINNGIDYSIKKNNPKYIALLNNDTKVDKNWLKELIVTIKSEDKIASVSSNMFFTNNPNIINSQGGKRNFICIGRDINYGVNKNIVKKIQKKIDYPCFGACLINAKYLNEVGLCDQRYSAYCEDLDWGMRANILGFKIIFEEKAIVYHKGSSTYGKNNFQKVYLCKRNSLCTMIKNYGLKNLSIGLFATLLYYPFFSVAQILNIKNDRQNSFYDRIKYSLAPYPGIIWNIYNLKETLKLRKIIQKNRKVKTKNFL